MATEEVVLPHMRKPFRFPRNSIIVCYMSKNDYGDALRSEGCFFKGRIKESSREGYYVDFGKQLFNSSRKSSTRAFFPCDTALIMSQYEFKMLCRDEDLRVRWMGHVSAHVVKDHRARARCDEFVAALSSENAFAV